MSDDDVEMVDVIDTPEESGGDEAMDVSNQDSRESELNAATRVEQICLLDEKIVSVLEKGAAIVTALSHGKLKKYAGEDTRKNFEQAVIEYNKLVEEVNTQLREEVELLYLASQSKLLPLYIPTQASNLGQEKEDVLLRSLREASQP